METSDRILGGQIVDATGTVGVPLPRHLSPAAKKKVEENRREFAVKLGKTMENYEVDGVNACWSLRHLLRHPGGSEMFEGWHLGADIVYSKNGRVEYNAKYPRLMFHNRLAELMHAHEINMVDVYWQRYVIDPDR